MLKKILNIKNLGLFNNASCSSQAFDKVNLIYATNGRGKTTLACILRSCATSDSQSIALRQSLGSTNAPEIKLLFGHGNSHPQAIFTQNTWSNSYSDILVFDNEFIDKNVYSGVEVDTSHREGLLEFALGEDAVQLKQTVNSETQKASQITKEISHFERSLANYRNNMPLKEFIALQLDQNIDQKIDFLQVRLDAAKNNQNLQKLPSPELLTKPQIEIAEFFRILAISLEDIEKDAEETVRSHINKYPKRNFEHWISQGQVFINEYDCPYCGQDISKSQLLKAYKTHFNQAYQESASQFCNR
ncbi:MAG: AAA family ATPase [Cyanobacteria bacterium P01_G01_bin.39]